MSAFACCISFILCMERANSLAKMNSNRDDDDDGKKTRNKINDGKLLKRKRWKYLAFIRMCVYVCVRARLSVHIEHFFMHLWTEEIAESEHEYFSVPHAFRFHRLTMNASERDDWTKPKNTDCDSEEQQKNSHPLSPLRLLQRHAPALFLFYCILFKINSFYNINHWVVWAERFWSLLFRKKRKKNHRHVAEVVFSEYKVWKTDVNFILT